MDLTGIAAHLHQTEDCFKRGVMLTQNMNRDLLWVVMTLNYGNKRMNNNEQISVLNCHIHFLSTFLYELRDIFLCEPSPYKDKAEKLLSRLPKQSLVAIQADAIDKMVNHLNFSREQEDEILDYIDKLKNDTK